MRRRLSRATAMAGALTLALLSVVAISAEPAAAASGQLTGTVRDTLTNNPLGGVAVRAYGGAYGALYGMTTTAANGQYSLTLPGGSFKLRYDEPSGVHQRTYSGGATTLASAIKVTVPGNQTATYDITMKTVAKTGRISGKVTDTFHRDPIPGAQVRAYGGAYSSLYGSTTVDSAGTWTLTLPAGSFKLRYDDPSGTRPRIYSGGGSTLATATPINAPAWVTTTTAITMTGPTGADCPAIIPTEPVQPPPDWSGYHLAGCDLAGANLTGYNLQGADLAGANLSSAFLPLADLTNADLRNANLTDAVLMTMDEGAQTFYRAILDGARITGANLNGTYADPGILLDTHHDWTDTNARARVFVPGCCEVPAFSPIFLFQPFGPFSTNPPLILDGAGFSGAGLDGFSGKTIARLSCSGCQFGSNYDGEHLYGASMSNAVLTDFTCSGCEFIGAHFNGTRLSGDLGDSNLYQADLSGADLTGVTGNPYGGSTATYASTKCPDGVTTNGTTVPTCVGHGLDP